MIWWRRGRSGCENKIVWQGGYDEASVSKHDSFTVLFLVFVSYGRGEAGGVVTSLLTHSISTAISGQPDSATCNLREPTQPAFILIRKGDTLDSISEKRYGHRKYGPLLMLHNGLSTDARLKAGAQFCTPAIGDILLQECTHPSYKQAVISMACARFSYLGVVPQFRDYYEEIGNGTAVFPKDMQDALIQSAHDLEVAMAILANASSHGDSVLFKTIRQLRNAAETIRIIGPHKYENDYDIDMVDQHLALAMEYFIRWARAGYQ